MAVKAAVEVAVDGDAMVVEMTVETETAVGVYNNQPKSGSNRGRWRLRQRQRWQLWQQQRQWQRGQHQRWRQQVW
jgi:hypothetical protein